MKFSKKIVIVIFIVVLIFTAAMITAVFFEKTIPDSLIYGFYGFFGAEAGVLGWIKKIKCKVEQKTS